MGCGAGAACPGSCAVHSGGVSLPAPYVETIRGRAQWPVPSNNFGLQGPPFRYAFSYHSANQQASHAWRRFLFSHPVPPACFSMDANGGNMRYQFNTGKHLASSGLVAALMSGGCALMAPTVERYPQPQAGTTWSQSIRDTGSYGSGSSQGAGRFMPDRTWQGREVHAFEFSGITTLMTKGSANFIAQLKGDTPVVSWEPPIGWVWPLEVGKTWTRTTTFTNHATKQSMKVEYTNTVEAYEDVTVPAGTFRTYRVKTVNSSGDENLQWWSPEAGIHVKQSLRRTAKHPAGPGTRDIEVVSQTLRK